MVKINTKPYMKTIQSVVVDDREKDRIEYCLDQYSSFHPKIKHLNTGDYIFKGYNDEYVCVEYKKGNDFLTSISNNHLHNQVYEMIRQYDHHFVIVEVEDLQELCDKKYYSTGISTSIQEINSAVSTLNTVTTVLFSQSMYGAFDLMMRYSGKLLSQKEFKYKFTRKSSNTALNYLSSMYGLGLKADLIVQELNLHTLEDLLKLTVDDLKGITGIGEKTARNIINELR